MNRRLDRALAFIACVLAFAILFGIVALRKADAAEATVKIVRLCAPLPDLVNAFRERFGETPLFYGRNDRGAMLVLRAAKGTWTLIQIGPAGDRLAADFELGRCVLEATGWHSLSLLIFAGVAAFGWAFRRGYS